jgi:tetratricopeptide (TPR) repeat protein
MIIIIIIIVIVIIIIAIMIIIIIITVGNKSFQKKQYQEALEYYMQSLKLLPFEVKTLTNIAQVHIKVKAYDDALEFLNRSIYVDEKNVKSLSRKCFVLTELGRFTEAFPLIVKVSIYYSTSYQSILLLIYFK